MTAGIEAGPERPGKPTPEDLGIEVATQRWERSGTGDGSIEIAFPEAPIPEAVVLGTGVPGTGAPGPAVPRTAVPESGRAWERGDWVLMRVAGDPEARILVFDRNEWVCFLDGVRKGEFDDAATAQSATS
jgi:hypothetical protein